MKERIQRYIPKIVTFRGRLFRFFGWWFAFLGLYSASAACPFCGQVGCPVGVGSAGIVAGFFAILVQRWKALTIFGKKEKRKRTVFVATTCNNAKKPNNRMRSVIR